MPATRRRGDRKPNWPTIEEQLRDGRVIHGSALERLIRENQDFDSLEPEEADDNLRLPPWLRVYWRKQHPETSSSPGDPTRGYPLALRDIYLWMITHQDLEPESDEGSERGGQDAS